MKTFRGPLKSYLADWVRADSTESNTESENVCRSLLAEMELDDWLEGRSEDPTRTIDQYRSIRAPNFYERSVIYRLSSFLPPLESIGLTKPLQYGLVTSFDQGFSPAQEDLHAIFGQQAMDRI